MDIAKYIATAVVLSTIFGSISNKASMAVIGALTVIVTLVSGLLLVYYNNKQKASHQKGEKS